MYSAQMMRAAGRTRQGGNPNDGSAGTDEAKRRKGERLYTASEWYAALARWLCWRMRE
ncbi:hypothetical protein WJ0W_000970 [Paenibacillus melissococcoides]|uniref:Uncharacterized protein n=1 Tax=Paenibacillus melissococcoides TaxID=2912268 RepID=A0ABM9FXM2_9BACL|nr:hypothetical protein WJ0W_000970 [Paenibacillus melissococcoides]